MTNCNLSSATRVKKNRWSSAVVLAKLRICTNSFVLQWMTAWSGYPRRTLERDELLNIRGNLLIEFLRYRIFCSERDKTHDLPFYAEKPCGIYADNYCLQTSHNFYGVPYQV